MKRQKEKGGATVTVHFESLCPDSGEFFRRLKKDFQRGALKDNWFELAAYGKTFPVKVSSGSATLDASQIMALSSQPEKVAWGGRICQHGDRECYGNAWQQCSKAIIPSGARFMEHTFCLMDLPKQNMPRTYWRTSTDWKCGGYRECVAQQCSASLSGDEMSLIESCVAGLKENSTHAAGTAASKGMVELLKNEEAKQRLNVTHVPWVLIGDEHVDAIDELQISVLEAIERRHA
jgi:hypothetical protein